VLISLSAPSSRSYSHCHSYPFAIFILYLEGHDIPSSGNNKALPRQKKKGGRTTALYEFPLQLKIRHGSNRHQDLARRIFHSCLFSLRQAKVLLPREFSHENPLMGTSASSTYLGLAKRVVVLGMGNKEMEHHRMTCGP